MGFFRPVKAGVHLGAGRLAIAEVEKQGGGIRLRNHEIAYLTERVLSPDPLSPGVRDAELVQKTLRAMLKPGRRLKKVSVSLSDLVARVTLIPMEKPIRRPDDVEKLIRWKIEKDSLSRTQELRIRYQLFPPVLLASSIHEPVLLQYEEVLHAGGLEPCLIDIASFHVFNLYHDVLFKRSAPHHRFIFIYAGDSIFTVMIFSGGVPDFIRIKALRSQSRSVEDKVVEELRSSLSFYGEGHDLSAFTHVFLAGLPVSQILSKSLGDAFPWEVEQLKPEEVLSIASKSGEVREEDWPILMPAIAAAVGR